jgi:hypothetical protein
MQYDCESRISAKFRIGCIDKGLRFGPEMKALNEIYR